MRICVIRDCWLDEIVNYVENINELNYLPTHACPNCSLEKILKKNEHKSHSPETSLEILVLAFATACRTWIEISQRNSKYCGNLHTNETQNLTREQGSYNSRTLSAIAVDWPSYWLPAVQLCVRHVWPLDLMSSLVPSANVGSKPLKNHVGHHFKSCRQVCCHFEFRIS